VKSIDSGSICEDLEDEFFTTTARLILFYVPRRLTAWVIIAGLAPILWSHDAGADVMKRIATPMVGGVITSTIMELAVYPAIYFLWRARGL